MSQPQRAEEAALKPLLFTFALFLFTASAGACPNLSGHYVLQGEDGVVHYRVIQQGCERVEIQRTNVYLGQTSAVERLVFIVDGKPHGKTGTINHYQLCRRRHKPYNAAFRIMPNSVSSPTLFPFHSCLSTYTDA
jgi:hypothetical protein